MNAQFPSVAISLDHFRFSGNCLIVPMRHDTFPDERLKVASKLYSVWRVNIDHLNLAAEAFVLEKAIHDEKGVAENQAICPRGGMFVRLEDAVGDIESR